MLTLFFDTETTGLNKHPLVDEKYQPEATEFYGCLYDLDAREKVDEFETLIRPTRTHEISEKVSKITGLTFDKLKDAPTFEQVAPEIDLLIGSSDALCGHNLTFDVDVIEGEYGRLKLGPPVWPPRERWTCTVEQSLHLRGYRLTLAGLHEILFGHLPETAHRARVDVETHIRVVEEMRRREWL